MSYVYLSNVSPLDRFDRLSFQLDNGSTAVIRKGQSYDLSATEVARISRFVVLAVSGSSATEVPVVTARLPVIGDLQDGDVPVWDSAQGVFVPGTAGGAIPEGLSRVLTWDGSTYVPAGYRADTSVPREFRGPTDPTTVDGVVMTDYDAWRRTT